MRHLRHLPSVCPRWIALLQLVLAATAGRAASDPFGEPANLFANGGFEQGLDGWSPDARHERLVDATAAHSGQACLTGSVDRPNDALRLRRRVTVTAGNRYDFLVWARGTNQTKLVLWSMAPDSKQRVMLAAWPNITRRWQSYRTAWVAETSGALQLEIISPSSHAAPAGQLWIDDLALRETRMPPTFRVSQADEFADEPALAVAADGTAYVAYVALRDGRDALQVVRLGTVSDGWKVLDRWQVAGGPQVYLLRPSLVASGPGVALVYAAEIDRNWDIYLVTCGPQGPTPPHRVTRDPAVDTDPAIAADGQRLWVAWESNRGGERQILVTHCGPDSPPPHRVSTPGVSSYDPALTVLASGRLHVAWHAFQQDNYDIYQAGRTPAGDWQPVTRLTTSPTIDRHARLLARQDELWLVYENAAVQQYHVGSTNRRHLVVARITDQGLLAPQTPSPAPLDARCEAACPQFDRQGRLWLTMLRPRLPRAGWDAFLTCYQDGHWLRPRPLSSGKGMDRTPVLCLLGTEAVVALQTDQLPNSWSDVDQTSRAASDVVLVRADISAVDGDPSLTLQPLIESDQPFEAAAIRNQRGEDLPAASIEYQGQKLNLYFGDLHEHSDISVCNRVGDQSLDESYQHMRDLARYDFVCITDHGYNMNPYLWNYSAKLARVNDDPGRYLTFLGQEWTSTFEEYDDQHPYGFYGHRNLILADLYFPRWWNARNRQTPRQVWEDLRALDANFIHIPHQLADTGNVPMDWSFHEERAQPVAEIFQTRGSYEYLGAPRQAPRAVEQPGYFLQDAWAAGIVIGVIASPDHGGGYGKACVFAPELTREAILDAMRARHCYGTTAAKIFLDVRVDGHLMGERIAQPPRQPVTIRVIARCPQPIARVEICRSNEFIHRVEPAASATTFEFVDRQPPAGPCYYYVRVIQQDDEIAWSSPVWFGAAPPPAAALPLPAHNHGDSHDHAHDTDHHPHQDFNHD